MFLIWFRPPLSIIALSSFRAEFYCQTKYFQNKHDHCVLWALFFQSVTRWTRVNRKSVSDAAEMEGGSSQNKKETWVKSLRQGCKIKASNIFNLPAIQGIAADSPICFSFHFINNDMKTSWPDDLVKCWCNSMALWIIKAMKHTTNKNCWQK